MSQITLTGGAYGKGRDAEAPELQYSSSGTAYIRFRLGAYGGKDQNGETKDKMWFDCIAFGELAEHIAESCPENGTRLIVSGRLESDNWTTDDGEKRYQNLLKVYEAGVDLRFGSAFSNAPGRDDRQSVAPSVPKPTPKIKDYGAIDPDEAPF